MDEHELEEIEARYYNNNLGQNWVAIPAAQSSLRNDIETDFGTPIAQFVRPIHAEYIVSARKDMGVTLELARRCLTLVKGLLEINTMYYRELIRLRHENRELRGRIAGG